MSEGITHETISIITTEDDESSRAFGRRKEPISTSIDIGTLRTRFAEFMSHLRSITEGGATNSGAFELQEVQFCAEISAQGEFKLLGTGAGLSASSAITFVLQRRAAAESQGDNRENLQETAERSRSVATRSGE